MTQPAAVHIGFPKCGSTTIQHHFFAELPGALFVSRKANAGKKKYWKLYDKLSRSILSGEEVSEAARLWQELAERRPEGLIFSDERITLPGRKPELCSLFERADHVRTIFRDARIILVLRHPLEHLRSLYQQLAVTRFERHGKLPQAFSEWLEKEPELSLNRRGSMTESLFPGDLAAKYAGLFGRENTGLFFLEDLKVAPERFYRALAQFMGLSEPPPVVKLRSRNVSANKATLAEIERQLPGFAQPIFPDWFLEKSRSILRSQAGKLHELFGVEVSWG